MKSLVSKERAYTEVEFGLRILAFLGGKDFSGRASTLRSDLGDRDRGLWSNSLIMCWAELGPDNAGLDPPALVLR